MREEMLKLSDNEDFKNRYRNLQFDWTNMAGLTYFGDRFLDLTDSIKLPDFFDSNKNDIEQAVRIIEWLQEMVTVFYVKSSIQNQFFLLHGITGINLFSSNSIVITVFCTLPVEWLQNIMLQSGFAKFVGLYIKMLSRRQNSYHFRKLQSKDCRENFLFAIFGNQFIIIVL